MNQKRKLLIMGNWKCNPATLREAQRLFAATAKSMPPHKSVDVVICPPALFLLNYKLRRQTTNYKLGIQDVFWEETGAYTGAIGSRMARSAGALYCILGHSERREHFGETNEMVQKKIRAALAAGLRVVLCVGERSRDGDAAEYTFFIKEEVQTALRGIAKSSLQHITIAYEPIWAVGAEEADTPERTLEMALFIRKIVADMFDRTVAQSFPVLYGGAVNARNARAFLRDGGVDGLLVGRASLNPKEFGKIVEIANGL